MSDEPDPMPGYELVMPFVTCASNGGPHDDESYTRGWEMGTLDAQLSLTPAMLSFGQVLIHRDSRPMADLVLARHGWHLQNFLYAAEGEGSEWHWCDIERDDPTPDTIEP